MLQGPCCYFELLLVREQDTNGRDHATTVRMLGYGENPETVKWSVGRYAVHGSEHLDGTSSNCVIGCASTVTTCLMD